MKKNLFIIAIILTISTLAFLQSCEKKELINEQKDVIEENMNFDNGEVIELVNIGEYVANLFSIKSNFKEKVYLEIEKMFDGDYNVLMKTIDSDIELKSVMPKVSESYQIAMNGFKLKSQYPQIYIPFFEEHKKNGTLGKAKPIFVPFYDETEGDGDKYDGYILENGTWVKLDYKIDEEYARTNEVWVISINERVDKNGNVTEEYVNEDESGTESGSKSTPTPTNVTALPLNPGEMLIEWQDNLEFWGVEIWRSENHSGYYEIQDEVLHPHNSYTDRVVAGTYYSYKLKAYNAGLPSAFSSVVGNYGSQRAFNKYEKFDSFKMDSKCRNWCCPWTEGRAEFKIKAIRYRTDLSQIEDSEISLPKTWGGEMVDNWYTFDKDLWIWDINQYAYNYYTHVHEDDGTGEGVTIKLQLAYKEIGGVTPSISFSFNISNRDEDLGGHYVYHQEDLEHEYELNPLKGTAYFRANNN